MTFDLYTDFDFIDDGGLIKSEELQNGERLLSDIRDVIKDIECAEARFNATEDEDLTESIIYELKSLDARYRYLIKLARKLNVKSGDISSLYVPASKFSA